MKRMFERFKNYLHGNENMKTFSEWIIDNIGALFANIKALFSGVKLFERINILEQKLQNIEAQNNSDKTEILNEIRELKKSLTDDSRKSQEEIKAEIKTLGKNIANELSILDESMRMLLVASIIDNMDLKK